jgi:hypothetical protein
MVLNGTLSVAKSVSVSDLQESRFGAEELFNTCTYLYVVGFLFRRDCDAGGLPSGSIAVDDSHG